MRIFLASSSEREPELNQLALMIERLGHVPTKWIGPSSFLPGDHTWESLQGITRACDAAVVVFGEDDRAVVRGIEQAVTRDNCLIEFGLFSGVLGHDRVAIALAGAPRIASDLIGINILNLNQLEDCRARLSAWIERLVDVSRNLGLVRPHRLWDLLRDTVVVVFGSDLPDASIGRKQVELSPNDLNAAFEVTSFLKAHYAHKNIIPMAASQPGLDLLLKRDADLVLIGGFVSNIEASRHTEGLRGAFALRMGRLCRFAGQRVYHPLLECDRLASKAGTPEEVENYPTHLVGRDHGLIIAKRMTVYRGSRRVISIAGIKGSGTLAAAEFLTDSTLLRDALPEESITSETTVEIVVSASLAHGRPVMSQATEVLVDGQTLNYTEERSAAPCELGRPCQGCAYGAELSPRVSPSQPFAAVVFDLDDTLVDTFGGLIVRLEAQCAERMLIAQPDLGNGRGAEWLTKELLSIRREAPDRISEEIQRRLGPVSMAAMQQRDEAEEELENNPADFIDALEPTPHCDETLKLLKKRHLLIILTQGTNSYQMRKLRRLGNAHLIDEVFVVEKGAQKAQTMRNILAKHALDPKRVAVVGNRLDAEIIAAQEVGALSVWIRHGEGSESKLPIRPDIMLNSLRGLDQILGLGFLRRR